MVAPKKRITRDLLHLALIITLLRESPHRLGIYNNVIRSNFFNDIDDFVNIDNIHVEGPNWAFSRANYHNHRFGIGRYIDSGPQVVKNFAGSFSSLEDDLYLDNSDDITLEDEVYRQQSRLLMLPHLNAATVYKDPTHGFRDITAYLVSDTSTNVLPNSLVDLPLVTPSGSSGNNVQSENPSPSPSADSGNDSGDEGGSTSNRNSLCHSETDIEEYTEVCSEVLEGGLSEEVILEKEESAALDPATQNGEHIFGNVADDLDLDVDLNRMDAEEFLDFVVNSRYNYNSQELGAAALPISQASSGPAQVPSNVVNHSPVATVFDLDMLDLVEPDQHEMDWTLVEEQAHLDFYKNFNDAANEMLQTVPILEIEGREPLLPELPERDETKEESKPVTSPLQTNTTLLEVIDDWLEVDSGVFDFLGSPELSEGRTFDFDTLSPLGSVSDPSDVELETISRRSSATDDSGEMIQAASMHASGRSSHHPPQPRGFQVHARMQGLLRGGSMDQRWQDVVTLLNLQQATPHDGSAGTLPPGLSHAFGPHLHHPAPLHHHFTTTPTGTPYNPDSARSVLLQNATLPPPDIGSHYTTMSMGPPPTIGSAVASSMHLTNSSDPMIDPSAHYKMTESSHEMVYYPNTTSSTEMNNQSTEGLFSSILAEDELQIMDMVAMNEGMHTMRLMDYGVSHSTSAAPTTLDSLSHGGQTSLGHTSSNGCSTVGLVSAEDRMEASSDSAVSSMGSERVPPMTDPSDSDWVDPDTHPHGSHESSPYSLDYAGAKGRSYDYYGKDRVAAPVAQKKHHMFGKRFQQEHGGTSYLLPPHHAGLPLPYSTAGGLHPSSGLDPLDIKYGCSVDYARHQSELHRENGGLSLDGVHNNHTYALPPSHADNSTTFKAPKAPAKDKPKKETLSRDEKRARAMSLPINTDDIINLPMDEFNERLSKYDLSEPQLSLIRDIRRRGKNKVAAQNCRKRKLDQIMQLAEEVQRIKERKQLLIREQQELNARRHDLMDRYNILYRHISQSPGLRDPDGTMYSLQQTTDGSVILVPRNITTDNIHPVPSRRDKSKDEYNKKGE